MSTVIPVFIFAGQSNMVGRTEAEAYELPEGQHFYGRGSGADKPYLYSADYALFQQLALNFPEFATLKIALGGTAIHDDPDPDRPDWRPDSSGELYDELLANLVRLTADLRAQGYEPEIRAVFWNQGEAETQDEAFAAAYTDNMSFLMESLRADLELPDLPLILGQINEREGRPLTTDIREQQLALPDFISHTYVAEADHLETLDETHFSAASNYRLGLRMFELFAGHTTDVVDPLSNLVSQSAIYGDVSSQTLRGTNQDEVLFGGAGDDVINGRAGNDFLFGEEGNDKLRNVSGTSSMFGGDGDDILLGGTGIDRLGGENGNDVLAGRSGDDVLLGEEGDDFLRGDGGADRLFGGRGKDSLYGNGGADYLDTGAGADIAYGGGGADILIGDHGNDYLDGGDGRDRLYDGIGKDRLYGGRDDDELYNTAGDDLLFAGGGSDLLETRILVADETSDTYDELWGEEGPDTFVFRLQLDGGSALSFDFLVGDFNVNRDTLQLFTLTEAGDSSEINAADYEISAVSQDGLISTLISIYTYDVTDHSGPATYEIMIANVAMSEFQLG